jgi:hypothetical protein
LIKTSILPLAITEQRYRLLASIFWGQKMYLCQAAIIFEGSAKGFRLNYTENYKTAIGWSR